MTLVEVACLLHTRAHYGEKEIYELETRSGAEPHGVSFGQD